jgi:hypothetical protein
VTCAAPTQPGDDRQCSALTGLEAPLRLIDHVNAAFTAHDTVVAVTPAQRFQRVTDFHRNSCLLAA